MDLITLLIVWHCLILCSSSEDVPKLDFSPVVASRFCTRGLLAHHDMLSFNVEFENIWRGWIDDVIFVHKAGSDDHMEKLCSLRGLRLAVCQYQAIMGCYCSGKSTTKSIVTLNVTADKYGDIKIQLVHTRGSVVEFSLNDYTVYGEPMVHAYLDRYPIFPYVPCAKAVKGEGYHELRFCVDNLLEPVLKIAVKNYGEASNSSGRCVTYSLNLYAGESLATFSYLDACKRSKTLSCSITVDHELYSVTKLLPWTLPLLAAVTLLPSTAYICYKARQQSLQKDEEAYAKKREAVGRKKLTNFLPIL
ncbi:uncharacterized protein LOC106068104 [Biomphalaria glabrata]|uniref:Uncharacterized protein LOC106068104 n=1 Tax=Biomphalaria glabrata TaxID=6526 RepID=A0A9W2Z7M2_BIOGL|nr:uncharacterized protein LOC106068104 [Biomphalaria glabrata]XP_055870935.1 uncharacterized protein LOC106068104 [Biomphalaria glabrata]